MKHSHAVRYAYLLINRKHETALVEAARGLFVACECGAAVKLAFLFSCRLNKVMNFK